jgi:hypothetical protein
MQLAGDDLRRGDRTQCGAGNHSIGLEFALTESASHLRRVFLAARFEHAIPVFLSGMLSLGLGVSKQSQATHKSPCEVRCRPGFRPCRRH